MNLGSLTGYVMAPAISDRFGRRITIGFGSSIVIIASIIQCATKGPWWFLATRLLLGFGLSFATTSAPTLTTELAHPRQRGQVTAMFQATWLWGSILAASTTLATLHIKNSWAWRLPCLIQAFFPTVQICGLLIVPESPRWLISKGRKDEALAILARYHANGDQNDKLVQYEFLEICTAIEVEVSNKSRSKFSALFKTPGNRHRLLICLLVGIITQWAGNGIVSYYLAPILATVGITSPISQGGINLGLNVWNAIFAFVGSMAVEKFGRRPLWLVSAFGMLCSFGVITALSATFAEHGIKAAGSAVVAFLFIYFLFYVVAFTPLAIAYPVEIMPYHLRTKGVAFSMFTAGAASFFNQYVNPIALEALQWKLYFVYIGALAAMLPIIWFIFPETKGRTLEEIAIVFDGNLAFSSGNGMDSRAVFEDDGQKPAVVKVEVAKQDDQSPV